MNLQYLKSLKADKTYRTNMVLYKLLNTLIGECEQISKDPTSEEILRVVNKLYKDNEESLAKCKDSDIYKELVEAMQEENCFLKTLLPSPLSREELEAIISSQLTAGQKLPAIMKYLSTNYYGRYNGKEATMLINAMQ